MPKRGWNPRKRTGGKNKFGGGTLGGQEPEGGEVNQETASF